MTKTHNFKKPARVFEEEVWKGLAELALAELALLGDSKGTLKARAKRLLSISENLDIVVMGNPMAYFVPGGLTKESKKYLDNIAPFYAKKYEDERASNKKAAAASGSKISKIVAELDEFHSGGGFFHAAVEFEVDGEACILFFSGEDEEYPMKDDSVKIYGVLNYGDDSYINLHFENVDAMGDWKPVIEEEECYDPAEYGTYLYAAKEAFFKKIAPLLVEVTA
jgi:hypothetical protein